MKSGVLLYVGSVFLMLAYLPHVRADSLRCEGDLAQIGDKKAAVLKKCGEPMIKDSFCKPVESTQTRSGTVAAAATTATGTNTNVTVVPCEKVDEWIYNPGPGQFLTTLRFERGELVSVKYGDRVP